MRYKHCQVFFVVYYQPLGSHPTVTRFLKRVFESKPLHYDTHNHGTLEKKNLFL